MDVTVAVVARRPPGAVAPLEKAKRDIEKDPVMVVFERTYIPKDVTWPVVVAVHG